MFRFPWNVVVWVVNQKTDFPHFLREKNVWKDVMYILRLQIKKLELIFFLNELKTSKNNAEIHLHFQWYITLERITITWLREHKDYLFLYFYIMRA